MIFFSLELKHIAKRMQGSHRLLTQYLEESKVSDESLKGFSWSCSRMFPSGITHEEMVQESKRHWQRLEQNAQKQQKVRQQRVLRQMDISHCFTCSSMAVSPVLQLLSLQISCVRVKTAT